MSAHVALMVGGPLDGQVFAVDAGQQFVRAHEPDETPEFEQATDLVGRAPIRVVYERARVVAFRARLHVFADVRLGAEERDRRAAEHLLSPLAKSVAE